VNDHAEFSRGNWHQSVDSGGICTLSLDKLGSSVNTLSKVVLEELETELDRISGNSRLTGLVIHSDKESSFIVGADITEFDAIADAQTGASLAARGQAIFEKLERLRIPTVAAINGHALGGGLELALACNYRVASESYERCLGLPEVQLGIHPGFGGTIRLVQLLGAPLALDLILTGRQLSPIEAMSVGLVDHLVHGRDLLRACKTVLKDRPPRQRAALWKRVLGWQPIRSRIAAKLRKSVKKKAAPEHYPAPFAIIDLWERHGAHGSDAYRAEAESIGRLFVTPTCRNLVRVFRLRERLKGLAPKGVALTRAHVVGAGVMGGDIAAWCALQGIEVSLQDANPDAIDGAMARAGELFARRLPAPGAADAALARLNRDATRASLPAQIAIEAVVEKLAVKREVFADLESRLGSDAVIASNTSSLRLEDLSLGMRRPERLVGLHFFNPVAKMPLVEVIATESTDRAVVNTTMAFVTQIGKLPLPCRSAPGFVVNRILTPYMFEALRAHEDGHGLEEIDDAAEAFGMPVGPIELADQVGLDVALHVARILVDTLGEPPPDSLEAMVAKNLLGRKTGAGFYRYEGGRPVKSRGGSQISQRLQDRLLLPLLNESVACIEEEVVADYDLLDAAAVFGTGFAPFRGGPIRYARERGVPAVIAALESLAAEHGERFKPHAGWQKLLAET